MALRTDLTPEDEDAFYRQLQESDARFNAARATAITSPRVAAALSAVHNAGPDLAPGVKLSLAQGLAGGIIDIEATMGIIATAQRNPIRSRRTGWSRVGHDLNPINFGKGALRTFLGAAQTGGQLLQTSATASNPAKLAEQRLAQGHAGNPAFGVPGDRPVEPLANVRDLALSTTTGQQVAGYLHGDSTTQGEGYLPAGTQEIARRIPERAVRGVVAGTEQRDPLTNEIIPGTGQTRTIGRQMAASFVEPGSGAYNLMSGVVDAGVSWYLDPSTVALRGASSIQQSRKLLTVARALDENDIARVLRQGEKVATRKGERFVMRTDETGRRVKVPYAQIADEARTTRATLEAAQRNAKGGVINGLRRTVAHTKAEEFLQTADGREIVKSIAADSDWLSIHKALKGRVAPAVVTRLQDAKTPEAVREVLYDVLGTSLRSTGDIRRVRAPRIYDNWRITGSLPGTRLATAWNMTDGQKIEGINNLDAYLLNAKVPWADRSKIVADYARGLETNSQDRFNAVKSAYHAVEQSMVAGHGVDRALASKLTSFSELEKLREYAVTAAGDPTDFRVMTMSPEGWLINEPVSDAVKMFGPQLLSEGLGNSVELGDPRQIRRLTSHLGWLSGVPAKPGKLVPALERLGAGHLATVIDENRAVRGGQLRAPLAAVEHFQNAIIKPLALIRPSFLLRVIGDEQFRMAASGNAAIVRHPLEWISYAMHNSGDFDAMGRDFAKLSEKGGTWASWDEYSASLHRGIHAGGAKHYLDPLAAEEKSFHTGNWGIADKDAHESLYPVGFTDELHQLATDPSAQLVGRGMSNAQIMQWYRSPAGRPAWDELIARGKRSYGTIDGDRVKVYRDYRQAQELHTYIDSVRRRINTKIGADEDFRKVIAEGVYGNKEVTLSDKAFNITEDGPHVMDPLSGTIDTHVGSKIRTHDGRIGTIGARGDKPGSSIVLFPEDAFARNGQPSAALMEAARKWRLDPASPQKVKYEVRTGERVPGFRGEAKARTEEAKSWVVNSFFSGLYGRSSDWLSRSPTFRQFYWKRMTELSENLSPSEANVFLKNMAEAARTHEGGKVANLLGGDRAVGGAIESAKRASGSLTVEQLDAYAKGWALDKTNKLLYSATKRNQLADIARVVFPFGEAWKEVLTSWGKIIKENPATLRRAELVVQGARDMDPDGDGRGFFYTNAQGNEVYNYPFSEQVARFLTSKNPVTNTLSHVPGVGSVFGGGAVPISQEMQGSVKGLNIGLSPIPSLGWVAQVPASWLLKDKPNLDFVKAILLPYGTTSVTAANFLPSWLPKIVGGWIDSPQTSRIYGDTFMRTVQVLAASGEYGTSETEHDRLKRDATTQARALTVIRGFAQATGPSSPAIDFKVGTEKGDMFVSALIKEYQAYRAENPDTALERFQATFGKELTAFTVSRTRTVNGGLDASKVFGDWERSHGRLFSAYPDVAGYMAPTGSDFDFNVYDRQLATGKRHKLSADEYLSAVNETIVNQHYYAKRDEVLAGNAKVGRKSMTEEQRTWMRDYKTSLFAKYPVPRPNASPIADLPDQIRQLGRAVSDKALADNETAAAARTYLNFRNQALAEAAKRPSTTLGAAANADLREWLAGKAKAITAKVPAFARVWDRVLSREID